MVDNKCMSARHSNCCSMKSGEEYCLYHKPNKNEVEAKEFYEKLKEQATIKSDAKGKNKLVFKNDVEWRGYVFPKDYGDEIFKDTTFKSRVYFGHANFEGKADFGNASFEDAIFFQKATFKDRTSFLFANFEDEADFLYATFEYEVTFWDATFKGGVYFEHTAFKGEANFGGTAFKGEASFNSATFKGKTYFEDATFQGWTDFRGSSCIANTSFSGALFERACSFANRKFGGRLLFTNTIFRQGVEMETDWEKPEFEKYNLPQAKKEGCRVQKIAYEQEGRKDAAEALFVREMRARRRDIKTQYVEIEDKLLQSSRPVWDKEKPFLRRLRLDNLLVQISEKAEYLLVDLTSRYGTSWQRIISTALALILLFACIYFTGAQLSSTQPCVGGVYSAQPTPIELFVNLEPGNEAITIDTYKRDIMLVKNFIKLLYFSMNTFIPVSYADMHPVGLMKYVASIQSLIGAFYIALFVVVFARKWMR